jgi:hypothetical protein
VEIEGGRLLSAKVDPEEKARTTERIKDKLERLRKGDHLKNKEAHNG